MRYLIQFLIPLLIFAGVVVLLMRRRRPSRQVAPPEDPADEIMTPRAFVGVLVAGGLATLGAMYGIGVFLE